MTPMTPRLTTKSSRTPWKNSEIELVLKDAFTHGSQCFRIATDFECVFGAENEEDVLALKWERCGISRGLLRDRGGKFHAHGIYKRYYKCACADNCNCQYIARVIFDRRKGTATVEQPKDGNVHNAHVPLSMRIRVLATPDQQEIMNQLIDAGCTPKVVFRLLKQGGIAGELTLSYDKDIAKQ